MSHMFEVGEIAIAWYPGEVNHGKECEIISLPQAHDYVSPVTGNLIHATKYLAYCAGSHYQVYEKRLRKRRPPLLLDGSTPLRWRAMRR